MRLQFDSHFPSGRSVDEVATGQEPLSRGGRARPRRLVRCSQRSTQQQHDDQRPAAQSPAATASVRRRRNKDMPVKIGPKSSAAFDIAAHSFRAVKSACPNSSGGPYSSENTVPKLPTGRGSGTTAYTSHAARDCDQSFGTDCGRIGD